MEVKELVSIGKDGGEDIFIIPAGAIIQFDMLPVTLRNDAEVRGDLKWMNERIKERGVTGPSGGTKHMEVSASSS